jgi:hypothetical protein
VGRVTERRTSLTQPPRAAPRSRNFSRIDTRELYLLVEGPNWAYAASFQPEAGLGLRQFAGQIKVIARSRSSRGSIGSAPGLVKIARHPLLVMIPSRSSVSWPSSRRQAC